MDPKVLAAISGAVSGGIIGAIASYLMSRMQISHDLKKWNSDFAIAYAKLSGENSHAARSLARQFAVGLLIVESEERETISKHFMPYQCRISVGRSPDNDIVLENGTVSRDHGLFFCKGGKVYFRDLSPLNKTLINGKECANTCKLQSGDVLEIGTERVRYEQVR